MNREYQLRKLEIPITGRAAQAARISAGPQRLACVMASVQYVCRGQQVLCQELQRSVSRGGECRTAEKKEGYECRFSEAL